jgi:hypothetical protein
VVANKSGHAFNHAFLETFFNTKESWGNLHPFFPLRLTDAPKTHARKTPCHLQVVSVWFFFALFSSI